MAKNVTKTKANNKANNKPGNMFNKTRMKNHEQKTDELLYLMALCPFFTDYTGWWGGYYCVNGHLA